MNNKESHGSNKLRSNFIRAVSVLVGGTALAHGITALALPVLSRLYSPEDFSMLAVFTSLLSIISVAACLRFDVAVAMPDRDKDAFTLLALSLLCAFTLALFLLLLVLLFSEQISAWFNQPKLSNYLWLIPLGVFLAGCYSAIQSWLIRKKEFPMIARNRIVQSAAAAGTQVGLGMAGFGIFGLLLGHVMNTGAACVLLGYRIVRHEKEMLRSVSWLGMRSMAVEYQRYPRYSTLEALTNSAAIQVPIIMIAALAVGPEAGYITMAMYVIQAPMSLFGTAIAQVYLSRAPAEYREGKLREFTTEILGGLLKTGVGPLIFVGILSPVAFPIIFGDQWARAGHLVAWMTPWFIMQFLVSPISMALHVAGHQKTALNIQNFGFVVRVLTVWGAAIWFKNGIAEVYALSGFVFYLIYIIVVLKCIKITRKEVFQKLKNNLTFISAWILSGITFSILTMSIKNIYAN
jgi:O-antigen/teichoic acid export membrane protein